MAVLLVVAALATSSSARAQAGTAKDVGVVSHIKVLSDKVRDVSSLEAWRNRSSGTT